MTINEWTSKPGEVVAVRAHYLYRTAIMHDKRFWHRVQCNDGNRNPAAFSVPPEDIAPWHTAAEWEAAQARIAELEGLLWGRLGG